MVFQAAFSPDGKYIAAAGSHSITLYDASTLQEIGALETGDIQRSLVFSGDGKFLASGSQVGGVRVWNLADMSLLKQFQVSVQAVLGLAFSPDSSWLAVTTWERRVEVWDWQSLSRLQSWQTRNSAVTQLSFSEDGEKLFGWAERESLQVWQPLSGGILEDLYVGNDELGALPISAAFSENGGFFASNHGKRIRIFSHFKGYNFAPLS